MSVPLDSSGESPLPSPNALLARLVKDTLRKESVALGSLESDVAHLYVLCLEGSRPPVAFIDHVPGHTRTAEEQASVDAWTSGVPEGSLSNLARRAARAANSEARGSSAADKPCTDDPQLFGEGKGAPTHNGLPRISSWPPPAAPSAAAVVNGAALVALHKLYLSCTACASDTPCYIHALADACVGFAPKWKGAPPPLSLPGGGTGDTDLVNDNLNKAVTKWMAQGIVGRLPPGERAFFAPVFWVPKRTMPLSADDEERCGGSGTGPTLTGVSFAASLARDKASSFTSRIADLTEARTSARSLPPPPKHPRSGGIAADDSGFLEDWEAALEELMPASGGRAVYNGRPINKNVKPWPFRLMALESLLRHIRIGGYMAKVDLRAGFYHIRFSEESYKYFSFMWGGTPYSFWRLCMGLSSAPAVFSWLTGEINKWLRAHGFHACIVYIDDFLIYAHTKEEADKALNALRSMLSQLGMEVSEEKSDLESSQVKTMLGVTINTIKGTCTVTSQMLVKSLFFAYVVLDRYGAGLRVRHSILQTLAGCIGHITAAFPILAPFTRVLASLPHSARSCHMSVVTQEFAAAILFFCNSAESGALRAQCLLPSAPLRLSRTVFLTSDASGKTGNVSISISPSIRIFVEIPKGNRHNVVILEFLAAAAVALLVGRFLPGATLVHGIDNAAAAEYGNKGRSSREDALDLLKILFASAEEYDQCILFRWYSRWVNHVNDSIAGSTSVTAARAAGATHVIRLEGPLRVALSALLSRTRLRCLPRDFALSVEAWVENTVVNS